MKVSVVIPSYNGWDRLGELCIKIKESLLLNLSLEDFEIIIVDDGSKNRSVDQLNKLRSMGMEITGVFLKKNYGQQFATLAGLLVSKGHYVLSADDDFSHKPEDFMTLFQKIENDKLDVVFAVPENSNNGILRQGGSVLRDLIFKIFFKLKMGRKVSSFRILKRSLVDKIISNISEYRYLSVEILKHTDLIGNIKVEYNRNSETISKYNLFKLVFLAISLIRCSGIFPERIRKSEIASKMEWELV